MSYYSSSENDDEFKVNEGSTVVEFMIDEYIKISVSKELKRIKEDYYVIFNTMKEEIYDDLKILKSYVKKNNARLSIIDKSITKLEKKIYATSEGKESQNEKRVCRQYKERNQIRKATKTGSSNSLFSSKNKKEEEK